MSEVKKLPGEPGEESGENVKQINFLETQVPPIEKINPVLDFKNGVAIASFSVEGNTPGGKNISFVADNNGIRCEVGLSEIAVDGIKYHVDKPTDLPDLRERLGDSGIQEMVTKNPSQTIFQDLVDVITDRFEIDYEFVEIIVLFIFATYFTPIFTAVPYLFFHGPKGSGKSLILQIISLLAFNPIKTTKITIAAFANAFKYQRCTLIIDQAERLKQELVSILADGYKRGGGVRTIYCKIGQVDPSSTYGIKMFASNDGTPNDLEDRCVMLNTKKSSRRVQYTTGNEEIWKKLRLDIYRFCLFHHMEISKIFDSVKNIGSREEELWLPIWAIAKALGIPELHIEKIKNTFDCCVGKTINSMPIEEKALLRILRKKAQIHNEFTLSAPVILELIKKEIPGVKIPSPQWVGKILVKYGLIDNSNKRKITRKKLMHYTFYSDKVTNVCKAYD